MNDEERIITFEIRYCVTLSHLSSTGFRVLFREQPYNIVSVDMMNYGKQTIRLKCRRMKP